MSRDHDGVEAPSPVVPGLPPSLVIEPVDHGDANAANAANATIATIATITLRRPQLANRLERADLDTLLAHVAQINADERVRVLRIAAEGRHFCSGFNIGQLDATPHGGQPTAQHDSAGDHFEALADAIERARPITIAAVQGGAYGGAVDLALACDFRIGTPAVEAMVPPAKLGLHFYRSGMERMVTRLGLAAAKRLLLGVEKLDAATLLHIGWLDRIVALEALHGEVDAFARHLAGLAPLALLPMKQHLNAIARGRLDTDALAGDIARAQASDDLREGRRAWAEKRAPKFEGR